MNQVELKFRYYMDQKGYKYEVQSNKNLGKFAYGYATADFTEFTDYVTLILSSKKELKNPEFRYKFLKPNRTGIYESQFPQGERVVLETILNVPNRKNITKKQEKMANKSIKDENRIITINF